MILSLALVLGVLNSTASAAALEFFPATTNDMCADILRPTLDRWLMDHREAIASGAIPAPRAVQQHFAGVGGRTVYNPSGEFIFRGKKFNFGRVEDIADEEHTESVAFRRRKSTGVHYPVVGVKTFKMQDPFVMIDNYDPNDQKIAIGGVVTFKEMRKRANGEEYEALNYRTEIMYGSDLDNLKTIFVGPGGAKGYRLFRLKDGSWLVFVRPQGKFDPSRPELDAGPGIIGVVRIKDLSELTIETVRSAKLFPDYFPKGAWGGINDINFIDGNDRYLDILGHVARWKPSEVVAAGEEKSREYYEFDTVFDLEAMDFGPPTITVERADIPDAIAKRPGLYEVVYPMRSVSAYPGGPRTRRWQGVSDATTWVTDLGYVPYERILKTWRQVRP